MGTTHKSNHSQNIIDADANAPLSAQEAKTNDRPKQHPEQRQPNERIPGALRHGNVLPLGHFVSTTTSVLCVFRPSGEARKQKLSHFRKPRKGDSGTPKI